MTRRESYEQYKRERDAIRAVAKFALSDAETAMVAAAQQRMRQAGFTLCEYRSHFTHDGVLRAFSYEGDSRCFGASKHSFEVRP
jgi:hypothetical protein